MVIWPAALRPVGAQRRPHAPGSRRPRLLALHAHISHILVCAQVENMRQRVPAPKGSASRDLVSLAGPDIDWVSLAAGMGVAGGLARTAEEMAHLMRRWLDNPGPFLIQAVLV